MHRQKRRLPSYVDAMTALMHGHPESLIRTEPFMLAVDLCFAISRPPISPELLMQLDACPELQGLHSGFRLRDQFTGKPRIIRGPVKIDQIQLTGTGRDGIGEGDVTRYLELDLDSTPLATSSLNWPTLSVLAVLAHLKCAFESMLGTGLLRVRQCDRLACGAFYHVSRMAGRSRFCSATCRACAAREQ